jgi:replicative DNA helicase
MEALAEDSKPIDLVTLTDPLARGHELDQIGDVGYLSRLVAGLPERPSIASYVDIVKDTAQRRTLHEVGTARD